MNVLVVGSGGRDHAIARRLVESESVGSVVVCPGNPGIRRDGRYVVRGGALSTAAVLEAATDSKPDLVVIGPAEPLVEGLADDLRGRGIAVVGSPGVAAAIGASKTAAKDLMVRYGIPTPDYRSCDDPDCALAAVDEFGTPVLIKADGLASGTGVTICHSRESAEIAIDGALRQRRFGSAGERVVIEQHLSGRNTSMTVLVDDSSHLILPTALDHTEVGEGGVGPNTLGMGALAPNPLVTPELLSRIESTIVIPSVKAVRELSRESGVGYRGVLHFVLILTDAGPQLLGYKIRFGDPETQAILELMDGDFGILLAGLARGQLRKAVQESGYAVRGGASCAVVAAVSGYPGPFSSGQTIRDRATSAGAGRVYYGMVKEQETGGTPMLTVSGGRVLTVAAWGETVLDARRGAYARLLQISFEGMIFRRDIGGAPVITTVIEEDAVFLPQFKKRGGLLPVVVQDVESGDVLMVAYADSEAVQVTRETGLATFRSTSRDTLWTKGETSGDTLAVEEIRVDCDQDALLYRVRMEGEGVCHTKDAGGIHRRRCFYRTLLPDDTLKFDR